MVKILAIGKGTQDVFLESDEFDPKQRGKRVYTEIPLGLKMEVDDVTFSTGGNATNVAVTLHARNRKRVHVGARHGSGQ